MKLLRSISQEGSGNFLEDYLDQKMLEDEIRERNIKEQIIRINRQTERILQARQRIEKGVS